jgi:hypothetical protein
MRKAIPTDNVFKPRPSQAELRVDATTRAAQAIIGEEASAREAKTERLRAARLAQEAAAAPTPPKKAAPKRKARQPH